MCISKNFQDRGKLYLICYCIPCPSYSPWRLLLTFLRSRLRQSLNRLLQRYLRIFLLVKLTIMVVVLTLTFGKINYWPPEVTRIHLVKIPFLLTNRVKLKSQWILTSGKNNSIRNSYLLCLLTLMISGWPLGYIVSDISSTFLMFRNGLFSPFLGLLGIMVD